MMKKQLIIAMIGLLMTGSVSAQFIQSNVGEHTPAVKSLNEKSSYAGWYNYGDAIYSLGGDVSYYRSALFPDSTVQVEFSSGMGYTWQHSIGQVLDPTSVYHEFNGNIEFNSDNHYTLDSVGIFYRYWRHQQGAPDTLILQVYNDAAIVTSEDPWGTGEPYARLDYDYTTRTGVNAVTEIVYLLNNSDTVSDQARFLNFPVDIDVASGEKIAATFTYIPGNSFNVGDTIDPYMTSPVTNKINAFYHYYYVDNDKVADPGYYNNQVLVTTDVRYNINDNGWNGNYIPGTAWDSGYYHDDIGFHITSDNVGVEEILSNAYNANLFPNPVSDMAILEINLEKGEALDISIFDISGKKMFSISEENYLKGKNQIEIHTSELPAGTYYYSITGENGNSTKLFNKVK